MKQFLNICLKSNLCLLKDLEPLSMLPTIKFIFMPTYPTLHNLLQQFIFLRTDLKTSNNCAKKSIIILLRKILYFFENSNFDKQVIKILYLSTLSKSLFSRAFINFQFSISNYQLKKNPLSPLFHFPLC